MIIESGNRSEFKQCLFENIVAIHCSSGHAIIMNDLLDTRSVEELIKTVNREHCCLQALTVHMMARTEKALELVYTNAYGGTVGKILKLCAHLSPPP
jgi:hypothetical protein